MYQTLANRVLLGMLTPSSNTILEPVTTRMIADIAEASVHFGRFKVTEMPPDYRTHRHPGLHVRAGA